MKLSKRMSPFGKGIFARLAELKQQKQQQGLDIIDLSIGAPNIAPPQHVIEALCSSAADKKNYLYALQDQTALLTAVSRWYQKRYKVALDPETQICSLLGSQEGLAHISLALIDVGDLVLVPDPCYPVFADGPRLAGAEIYYMPQKKENQYLIDLTAIPEAIARRAKFMILSYPNNPTTAIAPDSFYRELIAFARKYAILILHDNAYSDLVFDNNFCGSFLSHPGAADVGVEFNSLSKTYGLAGARIGFCLGNSEVVAALKTLKSNMDYGMFLPLQQAAIAAITGEQACVAATQATYQRRRNALCDGFTAIGWQIDRPPATMFVWAPVPTPYTDSEAFVLDLIDKAGVMDTPGKAFGPSGEGYVRFALVQEEDCIQQAVKAVKHSGILQQKN